METAVNATGAAKRDDDAPHAENGAAARGGRGRRRGGRGRAGGRRNKMKKDRRAADVAAVEASDPEFEALYQRVQEDPTILLGDTLDEETVLRLQRRMNPYAYVAGAQNTGDVRQTAAISFTNIRQDYAFRFAMTATIGFLFRVFDEWEVPAESRRWTQKKAAKRETEARAAAPPAWSAAELAEKAKAVAALAELAAEAARESDEAVERAAAADREAKAAELDANLPGPSQGELIALFKTAEAAQAKAAGLHYAATYELRKCGLECDKRIDGLAREAARFPEVKDVLESCPLARPPPGLHEVPAKVAKSFINEFLRTWLEYNPDAHVRKASDEARIQKDVRLVEVPGLPGKHPADIEDPFRIPISALRSAPPKMANEIDRAVFETLTASRSNHEAALACLRNASLAEAIAWIVAEGAEDRFRRFIYPAAKGSDTGHAIRVTPPADTFHRLNYYTEVNFEALRTATEALYSERPDLEAAIIIYKHFEGSEAEVRAGHQKFIDLHQDEVMCPIRALDLGQWALLGDFAENRKNIEFLNKHTGVLKRILDRYDEDKKLGGELMKKRVQTVKAKNIRETGPDAPGLEEYRSQQASAGKGLVGLGAERVLGREQMRRLERAQGNLKAARELEVIDECTAVIRDLTEVAKSRELSADEERRLSEAKTDLRIAREMIEVPDNAIQVDTWTHDTTTGEFSRKVIYTEAEAPPTPDASQDAMMRATARGKGGAPLAPFAEEYLNQELGAERIRLQREAEARAGSSSGR